MALRFVPGQRWLSQTEPELGLGLVISTDADTVSILFHSSETTRVYTVENPPLTRVRFSMGDFLKTQEGKPFTVEEVIEEDGVCIYMSKGKRIEESSLADSLTFSKPLDRLLNGQVDDKAIYNLRHRALYRRFKAYRSPLRGFLCGRYHPVAHQLYVATQATRMQYPRVLLADEPGLGRRVELGLILQRLQVMGSADRVLLLVPEADQPWLELEMQRRFGFVFSAPSTTAGSVVVAEAKPAAAKKVAAKKAAKKAAPAKGKAKEEPVVEEAQLTGPFSEASWFILPLEKFDAKMAKQVVGSSFDVLIVDGAEKLTWTEDDGANAAYKAVEEAAAAIRSFILVTPVGPEVDLAGHEARVRLLDPEDFGSTKKYHKTRAEQEKLAAFIKALAASQYSTEELDALAQPFLAGDEKATECYSRWKEGKDHEKDVLIEHLVDNQESGRRVFHNTRDTVRKLPTHDLEWVMLETTPETREQLREAFKSPGKGEDSSGPMDTVIAGWISDIIAPAPLPPIIPAVKTAEPPPPPPPPPKALVLCKDRNRAEAVAKSLIGKIGEKVLLITDAERAGVPTDTAAVVIGLEDLCGRTLSGVDFLLLWDLPQTPAEARAATTVLDFATSNMIKMYAPHAEDTPQYYVAKWLHDGLDCMTHWNGAQDTVAEEFQKPVLDLAKKLGAKANPKLEEDLRELILKSQAAIEALLQKQAKTRDSFLEVLSCRPYFADQAATRMHSSDEDSPLDMYVNKVLEQIGSVVDTKQGPRRAIAKRNVDAPLPFEGLPEEGIELIYNRKLATTREAGTHVTWDHQLVSQATARLLSTSIGNTAYVVWEDDRAQIVLLEGIFILEPPKCAASLAISRYMPPTPVRVVISHELEDMTTTYTTEQINKNVRNGRREWLRNNARPLHNLVPPMLRVLSQRADTKAQELSQKAASQMEVTLQAEIARLERMAPCASRKEEGKRLAAQQVDIRKVIESASLRLDSLRLLRRGPSGKGI